jgi:hypothetical protein
MERLKYFNIHSKSNVYPLFDLNNAYLMYMLWAINFVLFFFVFNLSKKCMKYVPSFESIEKPDVKLNFLLR